MRGEQNARALGLLAVLTGACGRLGYAPLASDGGGGFGGPGGVTGSAATGGGGGKGGTAGGAGAGGAGTGGSVGGMGGDTGGAGGADGGQAITCNTLTYGTHSYAFCDALVDWTTARSACEGRGMRLARIDDSAENLWLLANANFSATMARRDALWLGGYEPTVDGDWHWTDGDAFWNGGVSGTAVGGLYTNWDSNEPGNAVGPEACLAIPLNKTAWADWVCADKHYFACELY